MVSFPSSGALQYFQISKFTRPNQLGTEVSSSSGHLSRSFLVMAQIYFPSFFSLFFSRPPLVSEGFHMMTRYFPVFIPLFIIR